MTRHAINDDADYTKLKAACRKLISGAGGVDGAAAVTGKSRSVLGSYQNPNDDVWIPLATLFDLETVSRSGAAVTAALAELHGKFLIDAPRTDGDADWLGGVTSASKECCEAVGKINQAYNNGGRITADEVDALNLIAETEEALRALFLIRADLIRLREEAGQ